jgi:hypothetical protein
LDPLCELTLVDIAVAAAVAAVEDTARLSSSYHHDKSLQGR